MMAAYGCDDAESMYIMHSYIAYYTQIHNAKWLYGMITTYICQ